MCRPGPQLGAPAAGQPVGPVQPPEPHWHLGDAAQHQHQHRGEPPPPPPPRPPSAPASGGAPPPPRAGRYRASGGRREGPPCGDAATADLVGFNRCWRGVIGYGLPRGLGFSVEKLMYESVDVLSVNYCLLTVGLTDKVQLVRGVYR